MRVSVVDVVFRSSRRPFSSFQRDVADDAIQDTRSLAPPILPRACALQYQFSVGRSATVMSAQLFRVSLYIVLSSCCGREGVK